MNNSTNVLTQLDDINETLLANIQGGFIICKFFPEESIFKTVYLSDGWALLTGYTLEDLNTLYEGNPQALIHPDDRQKADRDYIEQAAKGNVYQLEYRYLRKDGQIIWVIDKGSITVTSDGYSLTQGIITDITPIKESEEKLRISEARFRVAISASHATVFEFDIMAKKYICIENAEVVFGVDAQTIISKFDNKQLQYNNFTIKEAFLQWYHPSDVQALLQIYNDALQNGTSECEIRIIQPSGGYIWCKLHEAVIYDNDGTPLRLIGHLTNIEEQHNRTERLVAEAQSDALTGLYNKSAFRHLVEHIIEANPHQAHPFYMLDIDNFKGVNDQLGHLFGDAVLMDISSKLKRLFRKNGVVGRMGGDEFVIMMQESCSTDDAVKHGEEICNVFRHTYSGEKKDYKISCSVGISFSARDDNFDTLFLRADLALYSAKSLGKDRYVVFTEELKKHAISAPPRINQTDKDSGGLKIKERIFELLYNSVDFSGSVNMILALLGQLLEASHLYIFENTEDNHFAQSIYEWHTDGTPLNITETQLLDIGALNYYASFNENNIFYSRDFSKEAKPLQEMFGKRGVTSTFQVAVMAENVIRGFLRYDNPNSGNVPTLEQIELMTFAAKVTGTFIIKKRADESHKQFIENKMEALDNLPSAIYIIDEMFCVEYVNNGVSNIFPEIKLGQKCHQVFMNNDMPCSGCPANSCTNAPCSKKIYNPYLQKMMIANAASIKWSGKEHMRLICCQITN